MKATRILPKRSLERTRSGHASCQYGRTGPPASLSSVRPNRLKKGKLEMRTKILIHLVLLAVAVSFAYVGRCSTNSTGISTNISDKKAVRKSTIEKATVRPKNNVENRVGYAGAEMVFAEGTLTIGDAEMWTKEGLKSSNVIYKESPNAFDIKWTEISLEMQGGTKVVAKSIESIKRRNFIGIIRQENPSETLWLPFEGIETVSITTNAPQSFTNVLVQREAYGRFYCKQKGEDIGCISLRATVSLGYPLPDGGRSITGMLVDSIGDLGTYDGVGWKTIPWSSVRKCVIVRPKGTTANIVAGLSSTPCFTYRALGIYADTWHEFRVPEKKDK
jgi:hypothetical protein